jgi:hypothetical protein
MAGDLPFRLLLQIIGAEFIIYNNSSRYKRLSDIIKRQENKANASQSDLISEVAGALTQSLRATSLAIDAEDDDDDDDDENEGGDGDEKSAPMSPSSIRRQNSDIGGVGRRSSRSRRGAPESAESPGMCARALAVLTCGCYKIESAVERPERSRKQQPRLSEKEAAERFQVDLPWFYRFVTVLLLRIHDSTLTSSRFFSFSMFVLRLLW